ncbi:hypothetical protein [Aurantivibrio infirmus]
MEFVLRIIKISIIIALPICTTACSTSLSHTSSNKSIYLIGITRNPEISVCRPEEQCNTKLALSHEQYTTTETITIVD